mmetsp:Transcript_46037/g.107336  ORF Transcript_46037/g.107336 Transcript_46037/m.107336 type:complete len:411 (-) Transcript_46037:451-1683(-)
MNEGERIREFHRRNLTWPPRWVPNTSGWIRLMHRREEQLRELQHAQHKWDGFVTLVQGGVLVSNFTHQGFEVAQTPAHVHAKLRSALELGMARGMEAESGWAEALSDVQPMFVIDAKMNREVLMDLLPMHEAWAGVRLEPVIAYGLRVYINGSSLLMHLDKLEDHVISSIVHIGHDADSEPWPLVIEGFDGATTELALEAGQMAFYESAKCLHGRPARFRGKWYSSIFVHYKPVGWPFHTVDAQFGVPPGWLDEPIPEELRAREAPPQLHLSSTGLFEPGCMHGWCLLTESVRLHTGHTQVEPRVPKPKAPPLAMESLGVSGPSSLPAGANLGEASIEQAASAEIQQRERAPSRDAAGEIIRMQPPQSPAGHAVQAAAEEPGVVPATSPLAAVEKRRTRGATLMPLHSVT